MLSLNLLQLPIIFFIRVIDPIKIVAKRRYRKTFSCKLRGINRKKVAKNFESPPPMIFNMNKAKPTNIKTKVK